MKIHFNSIGIITNVQTDEDSLRQGSVGTVLETTFEGINNNYYSAKLNFTRSDGTSISNVAMLWDSENTETFKFVFDDSWFFALSGATTITVFLYDAKGKVIANGQYRFYIEPTDYNEEPTITINQFNALMTALAGKVGVPTSSVFVSELPEKGESGVFYVVREGENNTNIYVYNANTEDYVWVGTNDLNLGNYTTKIEQAFFEKGINDDIEQIRSEVVNPFVVVANISDLPSTNQGKIYVVSANNKWYYWNESEYVAGTDFVEAGLTNEEITDYTALNQTFYQYILTRYTNGDHRPFFMNIESVANWVGSQEQVLPEGKAFGWYDATSDDIIVITNCGVSAIDNTYETRPIVNYNSLAERVIYDNSNSGLTATNVQEALDEVSDKFAKIPAFKKQEDPNEIYKAREALNTVDFLNADDIVILKGTRVKSFVFSGEPFDVIGDARKILRLNTEDDAYYNVIKIPVKQNDILRYKLAPYWYHSSSVVKLFWGGSCFRQNGNLYARDSNYIIYSGEGTNVNEIISNGLAAEYDGFVIMVIFARYHNDSTYNGLTAEIITKNKSSTYTEYDNLNPAPNYVPTGNKYICDDKVQFNELMPKASEATFGVAKIWLEVDEQGNNVLNIETE